MHAGGVADNTPWNDEKDPFEELVTIPSKSRDWKGIFISLLVIAVVMGMIQITIELATPPPGPPRLNTLRMEYSQLQEGQFEPNKFNATWATETKIAFLNVEGGLSVFDVGTRQLIQLADNSSFRALNTSTYSLSPNLSYLLLSSHDKSNLQQSRFSLVNLKNGKYNAAVPLLEGILIDKVFWIGDTSLGCLVKDRIVFLPDLATNGSEDLITHSGSGENLTLVNRQYNDAIVKGDSGPWVSPDQSKLAYLVHTNHSVQCHVVSLTSRNPPNQVIVTPPDRKYCGSCAYIVSVSWISDNLLSIIWTQEVGSSVVYTVCGPGSRDEESWQCNIVGMDGSGYYNNYNHLGWTELVSPPLYSRDGSRMVTVISTDQGQNVGFFPHIVIFSLSKGQSGPSLPVEITRGQYEVTQLLFWDHDNDTIFFMATSPGSPGSRHVYHVSSRHNVSQEPNCITCAPVKSADNKTSYSCDFSEVTISSGGRTFIQHCLGPSIPYTLVRSLVDGSVLLELDTNTRLRHVVHVTAMPQHKYIHVPLPRGYLHPVGAPRAFLHILLPPGYQREDRIAFPTIVKINGSPGGQSVNYRWEVDWYSFMVSKLGYVVIMMDVSGSGYSGDLTRKCVHRRIGQLETRDILHVIRTAQQFHFVDSRKMVVIGSGFGGYLAARVLGQDSLSGRNSMLRCGVSVSPISRWEHHNIYLTHKLMGFPTLLDNWEGYTEADLTKQIGDLHDDKFLLIHGMADKVVDISQSWYLSQALIRHGVLFTQMFYPGSGHDLESVKTHYHSSLESFLINCLGNNTLLSPRDVPYTASDIINNYEGYGDANDAAENSGTTKSLK